MYSTIFLQKMANQCNVKIERHIGISGVLTGWDVTEAGKTRWFRNSNDIHDYLQQKIDSVGEH